MGLHLEFSKNLKGNDAHDAVSKTYLGQAHLAGTGPLGKTCRECRFWHAWKWKKLQGGGKEQVASDPGYFGKRHKLTPLGIKKAKCNRPILNKADRLIPHHASSCRLFEQADRPLPAKLEQPNAL